MGGAVARQVSRQIIQESYNIANNAVTSCQTTNQNNFNVNTTGNCTFNSSELDINQNNTISVTCIQNANIRNQIQSQIQAQIVAQANAAAQSLGGPSVSYAQSVNQLAQDASTQISNDFTVNCVSANTNNVNINCGGNAIDNFGVIKIDQSNNSYNACANNADTFNGFAQTLENSINSTTGAMEADTLSGVVVIILVFLLIGGIFFLYTMNGPIGWLIVAVIAIIIIGLLVYAAFAFSRGLYPFNKSNS